MTRQNKLVVKTMTQSQRKMIHIKGRERNKLKLIEMEYRQGP